MTPQSLEAHLVRLGFVHPAGSNQTGIDKSAAAAATGTGRDTIRQYLTGKANIPHVFVLALTAVDAKLKPLE